MYHLCRAVLIAATMEFAVALAIGLFAVGHWAWVVLASAAVVQLVSAANGSSGAWDVQVGER